MCHSQLALHDGPYPLLLLLDRLIGPVIKITKLETKIVSSIIALLIGCYQAGHENDNSVTNLNLNLELQDNLRQVASSSFISH